MTKVLKRVCIVLYLFYLSTAWQPVAAQEDPPDADLRTSEVTVADCTFDAHRDDLLTRHNQVLDAISRRLGQVDRLGASANQGNTVPAGSIPRRNFVDEEIFTTMGGVPSAPLSTDAEFVRRIYLDLTGRLPSPADVQSFLKRGNADKRSQLIDQLIGSPEFNDKWMIWLGDLVQNTANAGNVNRQIRGRNAFHAYLQNALAKRKSLRDIAIETVTATGNNYDAETGATGYPSGSITPGGPTQDRYDTMLVRTATAWLGMEQYDCLLCHNGRRHLDQINLWGSDKRRAEAWKMAAFFARLNLQRVGQRDDPYYQSYNVSDRPNGFYVLNTNNGNRPSRTRNGLDSSEQALFCPNPDQTCNLSPAYLFTDRPPAEPEDGNWRAAFAQNMVADRMFARNLANRLWQQVFGLGLVEPVSMLDPSRLDPDRPPPKPWEFQATHPRLLEKLANEFVRLNFDLRGFIKLLVDSSAYQLSSRYNGKWQYEYISLFARHFPRRLEGEEIYDAISKATGIPGNMTVQGWDNVVEWAVQLPDPSEPRGGGNNTAPRTFMSAFFRGNRDGQARRQSGSLLQQLQLMNNTQVVLNRTRVDSSLNLAEVTKIADNNAALDQLFLLFLSRTPTGAERGVALDYLQAADNRNQAVEDLAWACLMKLDFEFSY